MTDEEHLREVIHEREHTIKVLHDIADVLERHIWELEARAEAAEKERDGAGIWVTKYRDERDAALARAKAAETGLIDSQIDRVRLWNALQGAHDLMFEYGFSSNDLRPIRAALEAKP